MIFFFFYAYAIYIIFLIFFSFKLLNIKYKKNNIYFYLNEIIKINNIKTKFIKVNYNT